MKYFGKAMALALALAMLACAALAAGTVPEETGRPAPQEEETDDPEKAEQKLTLEQAVSAAEQAFPGYTFTLKKMTSRNGMDYYHLTGTAEADKDKKTVYVSADDGTVLTGEEYKALKKDKPDDDDGKDEPDDMPGMGACPNGMMPDMSGMGCPYGMMPGQHGPDGGHPDGRKPGQPGHGSGMQGGCNCPCCQNGQNGMGAPDMQGPQNGPDHPEDRPGEGPDQMNGMPQNGPDHPDGQPGDQPQDGPEYRDDMPQNGPDHPEDQPEHPEDQPMPGPDHPEGDMPENAPDMPEDQAENTKSQAEEDGLPEVLQNFTLKQAIARAESVFPDYTFTLKKMTACEGVGYYKLKGKNGTDDMTVYVSFRAVLTREEYQALKKGIKSDEDENEEDSERDDPDDMPPMPGMRGPQDGPDHPDGQPGDQPQDGPDHPEDQPEQAEDTPDQPAEVSGDTDAQENIYTIVIVDADGNQTTLTVNAANVTVIPGELRVRD